MNREIEIEKNKLIISKTDKKGLITYGNRYFTDLSGYQPKEYIGKPHNIIRHPDMPKTVFKILWDTVRAKDEVFAYVKNQTKNGSFYWVFANVTPSYAENGSVIGYYSVRRKACETGLNKMIPLYKKMRDAERVGGINGGMKVLDDALDACKKEYMDFMIDLQYATGEVS